MEQVGAWNKWVRGTSGCVEQVGAWNKWVRGTSGYVASFEGRRGNSFPIVRLPLPLSAQPRTRPLPPPSQTLSPSIPRSNSTTILRNLPSPYARPVPSSTVATLTSPCPVSAKCASLSRYHITLSHDFELDLAPLPHKCGTRRDS